jgi:CheY-like chemotaxis protein
LLVASGLAKVTCLSSPAEALELLETKPCHLIFSDWEFDLSHGLEFLKKIRSHRFPRIRNICFVFLTADAGGSSIAAAMDAGADDYILKPLTENQIRSRINAILMKAAAEL